MSPQMSIYDKATASRPAPASDLRLQDRIGHFVDGALVDPGGRPALAVENPATGEVVREIAVATDEDVHDVVTAARRAQRDWGASSVASRASVMYEIRDILRANIDLLAHAVVEENGKTLADAQGEVRRGLESVEFACGLPSNLEGSFSRNAANGIDVQSVREPLGVAGCITPFNFPVMVPLWMIANALSCGNAVVVKPSEKAPGATVLLARLLTEAGVPPGVINVVNGDHTTADALVRHPEVDAVSFVGSTPVAEKVYATGTAAGKRVQALGGAKNHMVVTGSGDLEAAADAAVGAAFGAAGERCMAVSVLVAVGDDVADSIIGLVRARMADLRVGDGMGAADFGPLITGDHRDRVASFIDSSAEHGAVIVVDGRDHDLFSGPGFFIGPSLIDRVTTSMPVYREEVFGPVLAVVRVADLDEAIELTNANPFGNGAAIFTKDGGEARRYQTETNVGMIGVNVPIPVPVGWFSFGGWKSSLFGDSHMYGEDGVRFFTRQRVVTTRW